MLKRCLGGRLVNAQRYEVRAVLCGRDPSVVVGVDQVKRAVRRLDDDLAISLLIGVEPVEAFESLLDRDPTIAVAVELPKDICRAPAV